MNGTVIDTPQASRFRNVTGAIGVRIVTEPQMPFVTKGILYIHPGWLEHHGMCEHNFQWVDWDVDPTWADPLDSRITRIGNLHIFKGLSPLLPLNPEEAAQ